MQVSTAMQALDSSGASILLALENSDANHLIASIKDHVDNLQVCIYVRVFVPVHTCSICTHTDTYINTYVCMQLHAYVVYAVYKKRYLSIK